MARGISYSQQSDGCKHDEAYSKFEGATPSEASGLLRGGGQDPYFRPNDALEE